MRRAGYFSTVAGGRPPAAATLRPPRRVFAFERGFVRVPAPHEATAEPPGPSARPAPVVATEFELVRVAGEEETNGLLSEPPPIAAKHAPLDAEPAAPRRPVRRAARGATPAPPSAALRAGSKPRTADVQLRRRVEEPVAPEPSVDRIDVPPVAGRDTTSRPVGSNVRGARAPQLHIGSIDVTVVPPVVPEPTRLAPPIRHRPLAAPARPAPWFGLAQR